MSEQERLRLIREKAKKEAEKLFAPQKPKDVQLELEKTFTLGKPENLIKPDDKDE